MLAILSGASAAVADPTDRPGAATLTPPQASPRPSGSERADAVPRERPARLVTSSFASRAVRAALSAARQGEAWARLVSLDARAHSSALLPELIVRVARNTDESLRLSPTLDDPYSYSTIGGVGWWLEGRLIWHLDRLVFNTHELGIERLRVEHADRVGRLVSRVLSTLFAWQRASLRTENPNLDEEDREKAEMAQAEAEIMLDELTAGWFGRELARRRASE